MKNQKEKSCSAKLKESQNNYKKLIEGTLDIMYAIDTSGVILYVSPQIKKLGYKPSNLLGKKFMTLVHPKDLPLVLKSLKSTITTGKLHPIEFRLKDKKGKYHWVEERSEVEYTNKKVTQLTGTIRDISDRKKIEDLRQKYTKKLEKQKIQLETSIKKQKESANLLKASKIKITKKNNELKIQTQKLSTSNKQLQKAHRDLNNEKKNVEYKVLERTKSLELAHKKISDLLIQKNRFIGQVAHDLRTPLTTVYGSLQIMDYISKDKKIKKYIDHGLKNCNILKEILKDVLSLAELSHTDEGILNIQKGNISKLVKEIIKDNQLLFQKKNIKIKTNISKTPDIEYDSSKIREVITNLFSNSIKFIKKNPTLTIKVQKKKNAILFSISDNGIGMTKKTYSKIFEEFFKADKSRHNISIGLGLSICKRIIEHHHGKIWAHSAGINKGSTFYVSIPITTKSTIKRG